MATLDPTIQKSVRTLISRAQCALHKANMFNEITSFIDSDIELPNEVHDFLYGSIRKSHAEAFEALELLEKESLQEPAMKFETTIGGAQ